ncbi:hypothetical protein DSL72_005014 [Monilinia vaccinii-corymbosi]|uniref:Uncharacterized protein n=1 Tax=Monilinia vaccinii-corymbosi TaxID=61207 RepID=A0A8A3PEH7_9HELO|nr:hypothetical protein DSL72_005014 [Monilinia vaccinii-corymbosi]
MTATLLGTKYLYLCSSFTFNLFPMTAIEESKITTMDTSAATANTLRNRLRSLAISFELKIQKQEVQDLCSLYELGVIQTECAADHKLVHRVGAWWKMRVKSRLKELKSLDLNNKERKLNHIKDLILKIPAVEAWKIVSRDNMDQLFDDYDEGTSNDLEKPARKILKKMTQL